MVVPAGTQHQFVNTGDEPLVSYFSVFEFPYLDTLKSSVCIGELPREDWLESEEAS